MKIGLFVTCLVNMLRPSIGTASLALLKSTGCEVVVPSEQTCCGQATYNSGYQQQTTAIAQHNGRLFDECDYVVLPSGSCAGMISQHYPNLFTTAKASSTRFDLSKKTVELCQFLHDVHPWQATHPLPSNNTFTYHDSCAGLRELKIKQQPRQLMQQLNLQVIEMEQSEECCGFGGAFSVKFSDVSANLAQQKVQHAQATQADVLVMGDLGCMLNIEGKMSRLQSKLPRIFHISEILAHYAGLLSINVLK